MDGAQRSTRRPPLLIVAAALLALTALTAAAPALANNLDRRTAQEAAREVARRDCRATDGCKSYRAFRMHKVSRHKAIGKLAVIAVHKGEKVECRRQVKIKLDHETGKVFYSVSKRRCEDLGPA